MKTKDIKIIFVLISALWLSTSCVDLDTPSPSMFSEEQIFTNEAGITSYMAYIYDQFPMKDREFSPGRGYYNGWVTTNMSQLTGEAIGRDSSSQYLSAYWDYDIIRVINLFIETLPKYSSYHSEADIKHWLGEARFLRAFTYFEMVSLHGGVPIVTEVIEYPGSTIPDLMLPRNSEEACWMLIEEDYQYAIDNMNATSVKGRANKYSAAAYKSSAMLYAASVAKYNTNEFHDTLRGIRLNGIPSELASYFYKSSLAAAKLVEEGGYELYYGGWVEGDKVAQYQNFNNIHQNPDNCEAILVKDYQYPDQTHSWDYFYGPLQMKNGGLSGDIFPTLEFVSLFEGLDEYRDSSGQLAFTNADGTYMVFDNAMDPFENVEPRLRATVILPNDVFKGEEIEVWRGVYNKPYPEAGLKRFFSYDSTTKYNTLEDLSISHNVDQYTTITLDNGTLINCSGRSGTYDSYTQSTATGFLLRKNMDTQLARDIVINGRSDLDWIDMRYAEVLLNRAEASYELAQLGEVEGDINDAVECINDIRKRAGCIEMRDVATITLNDIREEFIRELAFENKVYMHLLRWRTFHEQHSSSYKYHALMPFRTLDNRWFFDVKKTELGKTFTFAKAQYYKNIPSSEITKNPNLLQND